KVVFRNKFYLETTAPNFSSDNDTIVTEQVFDNYLAYDDGTAEQSYFLNLAAAVPGKLALEFKLNQPDTIKGIAIYFGRQVPMGRLKEFSVQVYKDIAYNGGSDDEVYTENFLYPGYADTLNNFWYYKFLEPVPLSSGTFYIGTTQPAFSGSDSLYFGLD